MPCETLTWRLQRSQTVADGLLEVARLRDADTVVCGISGYRWVVCMCVLGTAGAVAAGTAALQQAAAVAWPTHVTRVLLVRENLLASLRVLNPSTCHDWQSVLTVLLCAACGVSCVRVQLPSQPEEAGVCE